jgi:serine/threonine-protein kinase RsbW
MKISIIERDDGISHILLEGHFDSTATEAIREELARATAGKGQNAIVDLSEVNFLASRGIGLLFFNGKLMKSAGQQLVILRPQELVESVLKTSRVEHLIPILHDLDEAITLLGGVASGPGEQPGQNLPDVSRDGATKASASAPSKSQIVKASISNDLADLPGLVETLDNFMRTHGVPQRASYAIKLAIDELVVNVICYAFVDDDPHTIEVELAIEPGQMILRIEDDGRPFDPRTGPTLDLHAEDREAGGLGLLLVLDMVDVLKYRREAEKNLVEIRVHLIAETESYQTSSGEQSHVESTD